MASVRPIVTATVFSRRRSRRAAQYQYRIPDWVWGLALGLVLVAGIGGYVLATGTFSGGGGTCDKALPALPGSIQVTAEGFNQEDQAMGKVIDYLNQADLDNAFANFYGDTHAFTHNIDPEIRKADEEMAKSLCQAVLDIEAKLDPPPGTPRSPSDMARSAGVLRNQLRDVAVALGFPRPGQ